MPPSPAKDLVEAGEGFEVERALPHGAVAAAWAMAAKVGLAKLLGPACPERDLALALVIARAVKPGCKLSTRRWWATSSTLGEDFGVSEVAIDQVYKAMDWLFARQGAIEEALARRHLVAGGMVYYDLSRLLGPGHPLPPRRPRPLPRRPRRQSTGQLRPHLCP